MTYVLVGLGAAVVHTVAGVFFGAPLGPREFEGWLQGKRKFWDVPRRG